MQQVKIRQKRVDLAFIGPHTSLASLSNISFFGAQKLDLVLKTGPFIAGGGRGGEEGLRHKIPQRQLITEIEGQCLKNCFLKKIVSKIKY